MDRDKGATASPPTDRVVAVIELLAGRDEACTIAEVADALGLSRSTVGAVLGSLDAHGWVRRDADLRYRLGARLASIGEAARSAAGVPPGLDAALAKLSAQVDCGAALGVVTATEMTFLAVDAGRGRLPAGITVGTGLPLRAPAGAAVIAFADQARRRAWLDTLPPELRAETAEALELIRTTGVGMWGIGAADPGMLDVLAEVVEHLGDDPTRNALRGRVLDLLGGISGRPYGADDLASERALPVSYLVAPVFDADGRAAWELQIGPLRSAVGRDERAHYIEGLTRTARELDTRTGVNA
ncbi:SelB domain-containing protein [Prescottella equi]|uniref:SelB domain-containing protein n=1 Tax=Rhodococcus hoagii TaxID=43767 RepID=UPI000D0ECCCA|nr:SelB C-terminal domain-containing protein [Prescottella equi]AVP70622.1 IclR family transcriptional regulator [Prescottella equi]MBM4600689.1 helix-turn-helix domain-containing protein [Prescottella equi]